MAEPILIGKHDDIGAWLLPSRVNRHGLITGATGTGKTISLQLVAESLSRLGVPTFLADVKGDLSGIARGGRDSPKLRERLHRFGLSAPQFGPCPVTFWDVFGDQGHPLRATVSDLGPLMLARMLALNETQEGVLNLVFKLADDHALPILDLKDLRAMLQFTGENAKQLTLEYGNVSAASIGAIQRGLLALEQQGGDRFFGEPMLNIDDLMQTDGNGRGVVNLLAADRLMRSPRLYGTFLLWLLSELFENLPEVGDLEKPKMVFFFDEAHLLFDEAPPALIQKVEQVVRLIRSKGVGVFFITQNPLDVPDAVLGQLGNRIQHALRAFTPRDQKAVRAAAETMRQNPRIDTEKAIGELAVGEALVSFLDEQGTPGMVERIWVGAPGTQIGPIEPAERAQLMQTSLVAGVYDKSIDRESAHEMLRARAAAAEGAAVPGAAPGSTGGAAAGGGDSISDLLTGALGGLLGGGRTGGAGGSGGSSGARSSRRESVLESAARSVVRSAGSQIGRAVVRGLLGSFMKKR